MKKKVQHLGLRYEQTHLGKYFAEEAFNRPKIDLHNLDEHKKNLQHEVEKLEKISLAVQLATQQIELYSHEVSKAQTKINEANTRFTKDVYSQMIKLKKFPPEFETTINSFMFVLGLKEKGWDTFKGLNGTFNSVKAMMNALNPENLRQDIVEQILPLWKNYNVLSQQLSKVSKGAQYLLDWMTGLLEMKIKSETLKDAKKKFPELQKKVREKIDLIAETNSLIKSLQEKKAQLQQLSQSNNSQILMSQTSNPTRPTMIVSPSNQLQTAKSMPFYSPKNLNVKTSLGSPMNLSYSSTPKQTLFTSPNFIPKTSLSNNSLLSIEKNLKQFSHSKIPNKQSSTLKIEEKYLPDDDASFFEKNSGMETQRHSEKTSNKVKIHNNNKISEESDIDFHDVSNANEIEISSNDLQILSYEQAKKPLPRNSNSVDFQGSFQKNFIPEENKLSKTSMIIMNNLRNANSDYLDTSLNHIQNSEPQKQYNIESEYTNLRNEFKTDMKRYKNASFQIDSTPKGFREVFENEPKIEVQNQGQLPGCYRKSIQKYFCV